MTPEQHAMLRVDFDEGSAINLDDLAIGRDHIEMVRVERMDENRFWSCIYLKDGRTLHINFSSAAKIVCDTEID